MARTAEGFGRELTAELNRFHSTEFLIIVKKVVIDSAQVAILATPIDTGALAGNWQIGIGGRILKQVNRFAQTEAEAISIFQSELAKLETINPLFPFVVIHLSNNKQYAGYVNDGNGRVAGAHMIEKAEQAARKVFS